MQHRDIKPIALCGRWIGHVDAIPGVWPLFLFYLDVLEGRANVGEVSVGGAGRWGYPETGQEIGPWTGQLFTDGRPSTIKLWKRHVFGPGATISADLFSVTGGEGTFVDAGGFSLERGRVARVVLRKVG